MSESLGAPFSTADLFSYLRRIVFHLHMQSPRAGGQGTGFIVHLEPAGPTPFMVLATAQHCLMREHEELAWTVSRFDGVGDCDFELTLSVESSGLISLIPEGQDLALLAVPMIPGAIERLGVFTPPFPTQNYVTPPGTTVAWAGYAGQVCEHLGSPHCCYFSGSISAVRVQHGVPEFIVDGHLAPGVSGGPMWVWTPGKCEATMIGLASAYGSTESTIPGFCIFAPIHVVTDRLKEFIEIVVDLYRTKPPDPPVMKIL